MTKKEFKLIYGDVRGARRDSGCVEVIDGIEFIPRIQHWPAEARRQKSWEPRPYDKTWMLIIEEGVQYYSDEVAYIRRKVLDCMKAQENFSLFFFYGPSADGNLQLFMARRFNEKMEEA